MKRDLQIFSQPELLAGHVGDLLMNRIACSLSDRFHLALSGGSTPNLLFSALSSKYADSALWQKTHFWWVDERMVPSQDPESNFGMAQKLLFSKIAIPGNNIHPIHGEVDPLEESGNYASTIRQALPVIDEFPVFDLILLGMGEDGHTASIFPNHPELLYSDRICEVAHHPVTNQPRITLTGRVINNADAVWFLVTGTGKAERLAEVFSRSEISGKLPSAHIHPVHGEMSWFVDEPASRLIS
ncbi:MAG: 6-phosphogluconolactonase [Prolixibacteraceae bacterium]